MLNFGVECEVASGTVEMLDHLGIDGLHDYHCCCGRCDPERSGPDWTAQEDCTSDGEFISRILTYGTPAATAAIADLGDALRQGRATHEAGDGYSMVNGVHVHVSTADMESPDWVRLWRLWFRYEDDIARLARGSYHKVRDYNRPPDRGAVVGTWRDERDPDSGYWRRVEDPDAWSKFWAGDPTEVQTWQPDGRGWVNTRTGHGTVEFRLWNPTRLAWRLHLAVGVSVALVAAAMDGVNVTEHDERTLFDVLHPYLSTESTAALLRAYTWEEAS